MHQLLSEPPSRITPAPAPVAAATVQPRRVSRRAFLRGAGLLVALPAASTVWAREVEPFWLDLHDVPLTIPGLPRAFQGLRVAQLTDLHMDDHVPLPYLRRVIDRVNAAKPNLVLITGDVVNHSMEWIDRAAELLSGLEAPKFVSFGNHDYVPWNARPGPYSVIADPLETALQDAGCTVLRNRSSSVDVKGEKLWIVGIEDLWSTRFSPADAFEGLDGRNQTILTMSHNPDSARHVVPYFPKLILAGHTHGGQI